jgi:ABC-type multidrug transport system fused ATPase/permease subunit
VSPPSFLPLLTLGRYGCDLYGYDTGLDEYDMLCENSFGLGWYAAWYFIVFIMIGVMVLVSLFTGVIITSMDLLRDSFKAEVKVMSQAKQMQHHYFYDDQSFDNLLEIFEIIDIDSNGFLSVSLFFSPPPSFIPAAPHLPSPLR